MFGESTSKGQSLGDRPERYVETKIRLLQRALDLGIATDEEKESLIKLETYRALLNRVNPDDAPDIELPTLQ
ncbi:tail fiber assembly protein [Serratia plymuthica]|uniref:tail fiber assembly protein n=1 Tax=Serratia plymuthica TaxID=82996 RepID=UPI003BA2AC19